MAYLCWPNSKSNSDGNLSILVQCPKKIMLMILSFGIHSTSLTSPRSRVAPCRCHRGEKSQPRHLTPKRMRHWKENVFSTNQDLINKNVNFYVIDILKKRTPNKNICICIYIYNHLQRERVIWFPSNIQLCPDNALFHARKIRLVSSQCTGF